MVLSGLKARLAWEITLLSITLALITGKCGLLASTSGAKVPRLCKGVAEYFLAKRGKAVGLWPLSRELEAWEPPILALEA